MSDTSAMRIALRVRRVLCGGAFIAATVVGSSASAQTPAPSVAALPTPALVRQLSRMQPADVRALIAPEGLQVCTAQSIPDEREIGRRQRCVTRTSAQLTDAVLRRMMRSWAFSPREDQYRLMPNSLQCTTVNGEERCVAHIAGPAGARWFFRGTGAERRLIRVLDWSLDS